QQRLRLLQIARVDPFYEPAVDAREVREPTVWGFSSEYTGDVVSPVIVRSPVPCTAARSSAGSRRHPPCHSRTARRPNPISDIGALMPRSSTRLDWLLSAP